MDRAAGPLIVENNKILLVREDKEHGSSFFMLPGGKVQPDETDEEACKREAKEEAGIDIEIVQLLSEFDQIRPEKEQETITLVTFVAKRLTDVVPGSNILEWGWYDIDNLPTNVAPNIPKVVEQYKAL